MTKNTQKNPGVLLLEFIDDDYNSSLEAIKKNDCRNIIYFSHSLTDNELNRCFTKGHHCIVDEETEGIILIDNSTDSIKFFLSETTENESYSLVNFLNFNYYFFNLKDTVFFRSYSTNKKKFVLIWNFKMSNFLIEEDDLNIFSARRLFSDIFKTLEIIGKVFVFQIDINKIANNISPNSSYNSYILEKRLKSSLDHHTQKERILYFRQKARELNKSPDEEK